jgi:hypothetical protein
MVQLAILQEIHLGISMSQDKGNNTRIFFPSLISMKTSLFRTRDISITKPLDP